MKRIILIPVGSSGDVHPFIALGLEFKRRGHQVTMVTNGFFKTSSLRAGFDFIELGTTEEYLAITENPDLWHATRSFPLIMKGVVQSLPQMVDIIQQLYVPQETIVVAGSLAFGARVAQIKFNIPTATIHLQPSVFRSLNDPPVLPASVPFPPWLPSFVIRGFYGLVDFVADRELGRPLNAYMKSLGLPPVKKVMGDWWHSPQLTVGLFPEWYFAYDKEWPSTIKLTGFPVFDGDGGVEKTSPGVEEFLNAGEAPLIFTGGSAMKHDQTFFTEAVRVCDTLKKRAIFLAQFPEQIPPHLPASIKHFSYVPFNRVFPRAAAIVHHGGIGTMAQCLKAGRPQLVIPLAHDQFDNAHRVKRLGAGLSLSATKAQAKNMAPLISKLLSDPSFAAASEKISSRINGKETIERTCNLIEGLQK